MPLSRFASIILLLCLGACARGGHWVELAGHRYQVEIADEEAERARGLMFRDAMDADHGMLFIHPTQQPLAYWMKNTHLPLDILYFDRDLKLIAQRRNVPPCSAGDACPSYPSRAPAQYVLELNAGKAAEIGVQDGAVLLLSPDIQRAK